MSVYAGRIKFVRRLFVRSFGHYDINEIQHRARQLCTSFTPAQHPALPLPAYPLAVPCHLPFQPVQPVHLPPTLASPSPSLTSANVSSFAWRPWATPSTFSAVSLLLPLPSPFLLPPSLTCPAAHFALISSQLCMQKCNVLLVFYLPNPPYPCCCRRPCLLAFYCVFHTAAFRLSRSLPFSFSDS